MRQPLWQRLDQGARQLSPFALTLAILLASAVPLPLPAYAQVAPSFLVMAVYFWGLHRPELMPTWASFLLGLVQDLLSGGLLGVNALVLLCLALAAASQRRFLGGASFLAIWAGFVVNAAGAAVLAWALNALAASAVLDPRPALFQYLLTVGLYPSIGWLLVRAQRAFLRPV